MPLTPREREIYEFIKKEVEIKGYPPSVREIGYEVGLSSSSTVHGYLTRLEEKGYIERDKAKSRTIKVVYRDQNNITKGKGIPVPLIVWRTNEPSIKAFFSLPEQLLPSKIDNIYIIKTQQNNVKNEGILKGDYLLVRSQNLANNGELVVTKNKQNQINISRFYMKGTDIYLRNENDEKYDAGDIILLGKVIGTFRNYK